MLSRSNNVFVLSYLFINFSLSFGVLSIFYFLMLCFFDFVFEVKTSWPPQHNLFFPKLKTTLLSILLLVFSFKAFLSFFRRVDVRSVARIVRKKSFFRGKFFFFSAQVRKNDHKKKWQKKKINILPTTKQIYTR